MPLRGDQRSISGLFTHGDPGLGWGWSFWVVPALVRLTHVWKFAECQTFTDWRTAVQHMQRAWTLPAVAIGLQSMAQVLPVSCSQTQIKDWLLEPSVNLASWHSTQNKLPPYSAVCSWSQPFSHLKWDSWILFNSISHYNGMDFFCHFFFNWTYCEVDLYLLLNYGFLKPKYMRN